jgi:hypothetical protein
MTIRRAFHIMLGWWPFARAFLITCALLFGLIAGFPEPGGRLRSRLSPNALALARRIPEVRDRLLRPVAPLMNAFGIQTQNWALFSSTGGVRHRMWIETRAQDQPWAVVYRAHDPRHTELHRTLEYRRVFNIWKSYTWGMSRSYPAFVAWVARRLCLDHPELEAVRVGQERIEIKDAGQGFSATGRFDHVISLTRDQVLPR